MAKFMLQAKLYVPLHHISKRPALVKTVHKRKLQDQLGEAEWASSTT